jgi:hypothetical protein
MGVDSKIDPSTLRNLVGAPEPETAEPTPFAQHVVAVLTKALGSLRADGVIEVDDANCEGLAAEVIGAALEATSSKRLPRRIVQTLIHSDFVEEVYGTDDEISGALRPFLEQL